MAAGTMRGVGAGRRRFLPSFYGTRTPGRRYMGTMGRRRMAVGLGLALAGAAACSAAFAGPARAQWALASVVEGAVFPCSSPYDTLVGGGDPALDALVGALCDERPARGIGIPAGYQVRDYSLAVLTAMTRPTGASPGADLRLSSLLPSDREALVANWRSWWDANRERVADGRAPSPAWAAAASSTASASRR